MSIEGSGLAAVHAAVHTQPAPPAPQPGPASTSSATTVQPPSPQPTVVDTTAATAAGAAAAKARIGNILKLESAKGREGLAQHLAFETELTPEQADAALKASPVAAAAAPASSFREAMRSRGNPDLGTGAAGGGKDGKEKPVMAPVKIDSRAIYDRFNNPLKK